MRSRAGSNIAALTAPKILTDAQVLLGPSKGVRPGPRGDLRKPASVGLQLDAGIGQLLGKGRALAQCRSVPIDHIYCNHKHE